MPYYYDEERPGPESVTVYERDGEEQYPVLYTARGEPLYDPPKRIGLRREQLHRR